MKSRISVVIVLLVVFLTACSQKTDLTFYRNQSWKVQTQIRYDKELIDLYGGVIGIALSAEIGVTVPLTNISNALGLLGLVFDMAKPEFRARGIDFNWHKAQETFSLNFRGDTFNQFNQMLPQTAQIEDYGNNQYHLKMVVLNLGNLDPGLEELENYTDSVFQNTVTLHAGHIISSNADEIRGSAAIWYNPSQIEAVFTPASPISPACLWGVGILVLMGIAIAIGSRLRGQRCPMCGSRTARKAETCPRCGTTLYYPTQQDEYHI